MFRLAFLSAFSLLLTDPCITGAQPPEKPASAVLFKGVKVFDGKSDKLTAETSVLVIGNKISKIGDNILSPTKTLVIDGKGCTLMPGLIDNHVHMMYGTVPQARLLTADVGYINIAAGKGARETLLRGFTSVRDVGGATFGLKQSIDEGVVDGPRIYPSGATLTQTSGHGDFRGLNDVPVTPGQPLSYLERLGFTIVADGNEQVIQRTREVLRAGASQIKVMAGGGVSSNYDPLDVSQYTLAELKAIVEVAATWNTYVTVHAFTPEAVSRSVEAGVKCIEHGQLLDEKSIRLLAEKGVWLSMQPILDDEDAIPFAEGSANRKKYIQVSNGTDLVYRLCRNVKVKLAWGTDTLFDAALAKKQGKQLAKLEKWFEAHEVLRMATHDNAELLKLSGPRDPYPGNLGIVEEGALADLILVNGDPLSHLKLIADSEKNFLVIMKDGKIFKNTKVSGAESGGRSGSPAR
jgi:imidazolonepropionase-like amidohydrolase